MATNQYLPFATAGGANVLAPIDYQSLASRQTGFAAGTALSIQLNSVWRQASVAAAMLGQFIGDVGGFDALDDGNVSNLATSFERTIQSGKMNYAVAGGSPNALAGLMFPVVAAVSAGLSIVLNVITPNTGAATLSVNGSTPAPVVNLFGAALTGGELVGPVRFTYDGTQWWADVLSAGLGANRTYFVNATTGSDSNNGLTSGTAFGTIQKAINVASLINLNGFNITISVADSTAYTDIVTKPITGSGSITVTGNLTTPANVQINATSGKNGIGIFHTGYAFQGLSPVGNGAGVHNIACGGAPTTLGTMHHRSPPSGAAQIFAGQGGAITLTGTHQIAGGGIGHLFAASGGGIQSSVSSPPSMVFLASSNFTTGLVIATTVGVVNAIYSSFTTPGNAPGVKFAANSNGVINSGGAGINFYPGASAGTTSTGGQYV